MVQTTKEIPSVSKSLRKKQKLEKVDALEDLAVVTVVDSQVEAVVEIAVDLAEVVIVDRVQEMDSNLNLEVDTVLHQAPPKAEAEEDSQNLKHKNLGQVSACPFLFYNTVNNNS